MILSRLLLCLLPVTSVSAFSVTPNNKARRTASSLCAVIDEECFEDETPNGSVPKPRWVCPEHSDVCKVTGVTLSRYVSMLLLLACCFLWRTHASAIQMMEMARYNPELDEIESIMTSIQTATKTISSLVRRAFLTGQTGAEGGGGSINVQGEEQKKLDVICNDVLKNALKWTGKLGTVASEEEDAPVIVDNRGNQVYSNDVLFDEEGSYVAVFDPLDGA